MSLDEHLPECLDTIFDCVDPVPHCLNSAGFNFAQLWNITVMYREQCPGGPWLFRSPGVVGNIPEGKAALTNRVCEAIAGAGWKRYANADVWYRLTTWKFPLFQLIFNSPRPPLGFTEEAFTIVHFLGDPIGTSTDLVRKFDSCQSRTEYWEHTLEGETLKSKLEDLHGLDEDQRQRLGNALALIVVSYDEWGLEQGTEVERCLTQELSFFCSDAATDDDRKRFIGFCSETARLLAADRSTKFLPVIIAQGFFIGSVVIAIIRTKSLSDGPNPQTYIDIETYSIGFTALFFWVISTVTQTSIIGASQTANAIPEILRGFRRNLSQAFPRRHIDLPEELDSSQRYHSGGIYSWQPRGATKEFFESAAVRVQRLISPNLPQHSRRSSIKKTFHHTWPWFCTILPLLSVSFGTIIGMSLTSLVPPDGWSCRSSAEIAIFLTWLFSYMCDLIPWAHHQRCRFWFTFAKDFLAMAATLGLIVATQIGIFNKCSCYTQDGLVGLALPQMPMVKALLEHRLKFDYTAITVTGIVAQLVIFPGIIVARYFGAVKVFLQRDDGRSDLQWCSDLAAWIRKSARKLASKCSTKRRQYGQAEEEGHDLGVVAHMPVGLPNDQNPGDGDQDEAQKIKGVFLHVERVPEEEEGAGPVQRLRNPR